MDSDMTTEQAVEVLQQRGRADLIDELHRGEGVLRETLRCHLDQTNIDRQDHHDMTTAEIAQALRSMSYVRVRLEQWEIQTEYERAFIERDAAEGRLGEIKGDEA